jgi:DeoR family transcriptional regulator of aga operon
VKENLRQGEKMCIAAVAAAMIQDGETILLDSGSTTGEIAKQIRQLKLGGINVITNALNIAVTLANAPNVQLVMLGGVRRRAPPGMRRFAWPTTPSRSSSTSACTAA